jgi:heterodisulfide reductase subunit B2
MVTLSYYPGCSLKTSSKLYDQSMQRVFSSYNIGLKEIDDWSCCGASAAHTTDDELAHAIVGRNLALAEKADADFFAPCSACYSRSKITNDTMKVDSGLQQRVNHAISPLECTGSIDVVNILEVLENHVGLATIAAKRKFDLSGISVVPYYGCVLTRLMRVKPSDDRENPKSMDRLLEALGVKVLQWPYKMECCGASKTFTNRQVTFRLCKIIMERAVKAGADAIVTPCPLCQMNLEFLPGMGSKTKNLPILFLTEVFEMALYGNLTAAGSHVISANNVVNKITDRKSSVINQQSSINNA